MSIVNTGFIVNGVEPKKLKKVPILILDTPGVNKKVYPEDVVKPAIQTYLELCKKDPTRRYIFAKHPKDEDEEWIGLIAGVCDDLYIEDKKLYADLTLLPTTWGYTIYWLLQHGYTIGTSIRGRIKPVEEYYTLESGRKIIVKKATYMEFEGFDFVVFPSYVVTQVTKEHVKEQRYLPTVLDNDIDILCSIYGVCSYQKELEKVQEHTETSNIITLEDIQEEISRDLNIQNIHKYKHTEFRRFGMNREMLQTDIERLKLEKARTELELEKLRTQLQETQTKLESLKNELSMYTEKVREQREQALAEEKYVEHLLQKKSELEKVQEQLEAKKLELEKIQEQLKHRKSELEKVYEQNFEDTQEKSSVAVRCCGKVFDENNPPKLRVVDVTELVSNKEWSSIDHDITRKLVFLSGDENTAKEVFGIVHMNEGWSGLKYPVYEHRKSSEDGYDVDLVLNLNGLKTALVFLQGRPGLALTKDEKKQLVEFLLKKYQELKDAGIIENIPESLLNLAKSLKVLEQIKFNVDDELVSTLLETAFEKGLIEVELDNTQESIEVEIDPDLVYENFAIALSKSLEGTTLIDVLEQMNRGNNVQVTSYNDGIEKLWNLLADTQFAQQLQLTTKDDFEAYIKQIVNSLFNGEIVSALKAIDVLQNALRGTGAVHAVIPVLILAVDKFSNSNNAESEQTGETTNAEQPTENSEQINEQKFEIPEFKDTEKTQEQMEDAMTDRTFNALKKLLETNFENVEITDENTLIPVIEKLVDDYISTYENEEQLKFEVAKKDALIKALEKGINLEVAKEKIEKAQSIDDLNTILDELLESDKPEKVQEQAGKGRAVVDCADTKVDNFNSLLEEI